MRFHATPPAVGPRAALALLVAAGALAGCGGSGSALRGTLQPASPDAIVMAWPTQGVLAPRSREMVRVLQAKERFTPATVIVSVGATLAFENRDRVWHNAFAIVPENKFDLGHYPGGDVRHVTLERPGVVDVFCELHPRETMRVVVVPAGWRTRPDEQGQFAFKGLPRGSYVVRAWHPTNGEATATVDVPGPAPTVLRLRSGRPDGGPRAAN